MRTVGLVAAATAILFASQATSLSADSGVLPKYKASFTTRLDFGRAIQTPYMLDSADVDGDGSDDFAVGAKIVPPRGRNVLSAPKIVSFVVQNLPAKGALRPYSLGNDSLTHRTWTGAFLRPTDGAPMHFVLGRNGEIGLPNELVGEPTTIYRIEPGTDGWQVAPVFVSKTLNTTQSVSVCDIDGKGDLEIFVNNVASAMSRGVPPYNEARMYQYKGGKFVPRSPHPFLLGMQDGDVSVHNYIVLDDIDRDGDCDFLAAYESLAPIKRNGPMVGAMGFPYAQSDIDKHQSYVIFNEDGRFRSGIHLLPNPAFGRRTSAFGIGGTRTPAGEIIVAVTSSSIHSHEEGFRGFALQLYAWKDGAFVEVTKERLVGNVNNAIANQSYIRFADIDGDGDEDFYLTRYDNNVVAFMQSGGKFVARRLPVQGLSGEKAVVFLKAAGKPCMDLAILDSARKLTRYSCS